MRSALAMVAAALMTLGVATPAVAGPSSGPRSRPAMAGAVCRAAGPTRGSCVKRVHLRSAPKLQPAAVTPSASGTAYSYVALAPQRIADTRSGSGEPYAGQTLGAGSTLAVQVAGVGGVASSGATAVVLSVIATGGSASTVLNVFATGTTRPSSTSSLNVAAGTTVNNQVTVKLGTGGKVSIYSSAGTIDVIVDVAGYYSSTGGTGLMPITPVRIVDTRAGSGKQHAGQPLPAGGTLNVQVAGFAAIPKTATAAVLDLTIVAPGAGGYLSAYPAGISRPNPASSMNFASGLNLTRAATVRLGSNPMGAIKIYNSASQSITLLVDVAGYFVANPADGFTAVTPTRIADTRTGSGKPYAGQHLAAAGTLAIQVTGVGGVPAGADAAVVNLTVPAGTSGTRFLTAYPGGTHPVANSLYYTGHTAFNEVTVKLSSSGTFTLYNSSGTTDVVVDVLGYYTSPPVPPPPVLPDPPVTCQFAAGDAYEPSPSRYLSCAATEWELFTYATDANGNLQITGSMNVTDRQWNTYSATSLTWTHDVRITVASDAEGWLSGGANAVIRPTCAAASDCTLTNTVGSDWSVAQTLVPGTTLSNEFTEADTSAAATSSTPARTYRDPDADTGLGITFAGQAGGSVPVWNFADPYLAGRCDIYLTGSNTPNRGCVDYQYTPTLSLSISKFGSSAAMIQWAQAHEAAEWGLASGGHPLHYLPGGGNRTIMCTNSFAPDAALNAALVPYSSQDSCDEFPFAATYESPVNPALPGQPAKPPFADGAACAQLTAVQVANPNPAPANLAADWPSVAVYSATPTGSELCVRGHIPLLLNTSVGTAYSNFLQPGSGCVPGASPGTGCRLIDQDPFWIAVTA